jgi:DNA-binding Lrp family transcriptional regulator
MLALLAQDARTPVAQLAALTGLHESSARRRLDQLLRSGHVTFEVDLDWFPGAGMHVLLWASVDPAELDNVGKALSNEPYVPFAAATTGPTNLLASVVASGAEDLYSWLTSHLGRNLGIERVETAPVMKVLKRHGQLTAHTLSVSAGRARSAS